MFVIQVSYAIGVAAPLSISLFTYGSSQKSEKELLHIVNKNFDLRPGVIVRWDNILVNFPSVIHSVFPDHATRP